MIASRNTAVVAGLNIIFQRAKWRTRVTGEGHDRTENLKADMMVVDVCPQGGVSEDWLDRIEQSNSDTPVLIFGPNGHHRYPSIPATASPREIIQAARKVMCGGKSLQIKPSSTLPEDGFTRREREVYQLLARGRRNRHIAAKLGISVKTVETHKEHLKHKLNLESTADLMDHAIASSVQA